jgi:L-fuconolactonase
MEPEMTDRIDAHQHFWDPARRFPLVDSWLQGAVTYGWSEAGLPQLNRPFLPVHLEHELSGVGVGHTIAVQAINSIGETRWLLELSDENPSIAGVVGWIDLAQPSELVQHDLDRLRHPKLVGVRHLVQFEPDPGWLLRPNVLAGLRLLAAAGLPYDLLVTAAHLPLLPELSAAVPDLVMVIDHAAKPQIRDGLIDPWERDIRAAAENPMISCKLSGLVTEADHERWTGADLRPYIEVVADAFGVHRVMFGSDWPVCTLAATYGQVAAALDEELGRILAGDAAAERAIFRENALRVYALEGLAAVQPGSA